MGGNPSETVLGEVASGDVPASLRDSRSFPHGPVLSKIFFSESSMVPAGEEQTKVRFDS